MGLTTVVARLGGIPPLGAYCDELDIMTRAERVRDMEAINHPNLEREKHRLKEKKTKFFDQLSHALKAAGVSWNDLRAELVKEYGEEVAEGMVGPVSGARESPARTVTCKFCNQPCDATAAHLHDGSWVGDECCWDERLRSTE